MRYKEDIVSLITKTHELFLYVRNDYAVKKLVSAIAPIAAANMPNINSSGVPHLF